MVFQAAAKAEAAVRADPRSACFYARRALELAVSWAYKHDPALRLPYRDNLSALIHEPSFKDTAGEAVFNKARVIVTLGNRAVHSHRPIAEADALAAVRELFHVGYWLARTYGRVARPDPGLTFNAATLAQPAHAAAQTAEQLQALESKLRDKDESLATLLADKSALDDELKRLRAEVAAAKKAAAARPDDHDYSEAQTRDYFIDLLLKEAGWPLDQERDREYEVEGMPNEKGVGYVDYVLWGDDSKPVGLVEAKRTRRDARVGEHQAWLYANCLEQRSGQRPIIFYSNGYEHWIWDDTRYPPRPVQGFYKKAELELLIQRRESRKPLASAPISKAIVERYYQTRAIRRIAESFERDHERKALLVMATGAGKTRTVIALADLLMHCNWVKRALFLADRVALVNQAVNAFKAFLPDASPVNLVAEKHAEGRVYVSTYPTMMGLIDEAADGQRRFGVGHFDLIVIDEAHRSVFQKYGAILDYFDALLVGLTATPKDEVDRNTYRLFDLENGVPTDSYALDDAVRDGFLVPPQAVSVPLKFQREGIAYALLSEEDKDQWDPLEWDDEGNVLERVGTEGSSVASLAKRLFDARLELIGALDRVSGDLAITLKDVMADYAGPRTGAEVRQAIARHPQGEVAAMNVDNFVVRPHRRLVEKYAKEEAWQVLAADAVAALSQQVAGLPTELDPEDEDAKRFDLLALHLQLARLNVEPGFERLRGRVTEIAALLEEKEAIPLVREQMPLIQAVQTDEWWQDVTVPLLDVMRRRLRALVQFIDKHHRKIVYTDFEDERGDDTHVVLPGFAVGTDQARFRAKAQAFLRQHLDHAAVRKLRINQALAPGDMQDLEQLFIEGGVGGVDEIQRAAAHAQGLGLLVRFLVGMDRAAAKEALGNFAGGKTLTANQIEFVNLVIDHLAEHGVVEPASLYASPFTGVSARGPEGLFVPTELDALLRSLDAVKASAVVA